MPGDRDTNRDELRAVQIALNSFYADCLYALGEHARKKGATANGSPTVLKRVAQEWGIAAADQMILPRLTRQAHDELSLPTWQPGKAR